MKKRNRIAALLLALALIPALSCCAVVEDPRTSGSDGTLKPGENISDTPSDDTPGPKPGEDPSRDMSGDPTDADDTDVPEGPDIPTPSAGALRIGLCADAAAIGAAGLAKNEEYRLVFGTPDLTAAFSNGELDAALVPIDAAAQIYAATDGKVRLAAVTASGGWKVVERGTAVRDIWGLAGKTVYVPQESSMAVGLFEYVATGYDFMIGDTLMIEAVPTSELSQYDLALMPATIAGSLIVRDADTHLALDLGEELENITGMQLLPVGCLIVASGMDAGKVETLLGDLKASQDSLSENLDMAVALGMAASEEEAWAAAHDSCRLGWYTGEEMRDRVESFMTLLYSLDPALLGGHIPDDGFYA